MKEYLQGTNRHWAPGEWERHVAADRKASLAKRVAENTRPNPHRARLLENAPSEPIPDLAEMLTPSCSATVDRIIEGTVAAIVRQDEFHTRVPARLSRKVEGSKQMSKPKLRVFGPAGYNATGALVREAVKNERSGAALIADVVKLELDLSEADRARIENRVDSTLHELQAQRAGDGDPDDAPDPIDAFDSENPPFCAGCGAHLAGGADHEDECVFGENPLPVDSDREDDEEAGLPIDDEPFKDGEREDDGALAAEGNDDPDPLANATRGRQKVAPKKERLLVFGPGRRMIERARPRKGAALEAACFTGEHTLASAADAPRWRRS